MKLIDRLKKEFPTLNEYLLFEIIEEAKEKVNKEEENAEKM